MCTVVILEIVHCFTYCLDFFYLNIPCDVISHIYFSLSYYVLQVLQVTDTVYGLHRLVRKRRARVCLCEHSGSDRIPRLLHLNHASCARCVDKMCKTDSLICSVSCLLCRWITCTRGSLTLPGALWANTGIWDQIAEEQQGREDRLVEDLSDTKTQLIKSTLSISFKAAPQ